MSEPSILRTAQPSLRRSWRGLAAGVLSALSGIALLATSAYLITRAAEEPPILYLSIAIVSVRLFALSRAFFRYLDRLATHDAAFRQLAVVRTQLYRRLVRIAPAGLRQVARGDLLSRLVSDVDALQDLPLRVVQPLAVSAVSALGAVIAVVLISPVSGLTLAVVLVAAFAGGSVVANVQAGQTERTLADRRGALGAAVLDTIQNLDVLVAFDALDAQLDRVRSLDADLRRASLRRASTSGVVAALIALLSGAAVLAITGVASPSLGHGIQGPEFALVALVPLAVFEVVGAVPVGVIAWRKVRASAERVESAAPSDVPPEIVFDRLDEKPAGDGPGGDGPGGDGIGDDATRDDAREFVSATPAPVALPEAGGTAIRLSGLEAHWPRAQRSALDGISLEVRVGERILLEGPSGAGKSTLASVLVRFLDYEGSYELAGTEARTLDPERVRATVGLLEQTPYLFDETVRQNLLFARDTASDQDLEDVLARVGLREWLAERGGLGARLGERGALVSGGQAQRISLARALLRGFPILVLDEPAAGVDPDRADSLLDDVLRTAEDTATTLIVISHVPVPPERLTRRVVLDDASIVLDSAVALTE